MLRNVWCQCLQEAEYTTPRRAGLLELYLISMLQLGEAIVLRMVMEGMQPVARSNSPMLDGSSHLLVVQCLSLQRTALRTSILEAVSLQHVLLCSVPAAF